MLSKTSFPKDLINIVKTIKNKGFQCYIVGGAVRDLLLGLEVTNWDLTTDARPEQVTKLFKKVIPTGIDYGTVTVLENKVPYEITTFRCDEKYTDGRHPSNVKFSKDLISDLARRDFTINAIAYDPLKDKIIDEYEGQNDIKKKVIRTVGDPVERFREDGLRPLRACRLAAKLDFTIDKKTLDAIPKCLDIAKKVSMERVHDELMKILSADKPSVGIDLMRKSGLLSVYIPELEKGIGVEQPKPFHKDDVYWHSLYCCDAVSKNKPLLRLTALLHDIAKPDCKVDMTFYDHENKGMDAALKILKRLKFSNDNIEYVTSLIRNHMFNYSSEWSDSAVRRFMRRVGLKNLEDLFELRVADILSMGRGVEDGHPKELRKRIRKIIDEQNALHIKDLKVDGSVVMELLKIEQGPMVGEVLEAVLEKVLDDPKLNTTEQLTELIMEFKS